MEALRIARLLQEGCTAAPVRLQLCACAADRCTVCCAAANHPHFFITPGHAHACIAGQPPAKRSFPSRSSSLASSFSSSSSFSLALARAAAGVFWAASPSSPLTAPMATLPAVPAGGPSGNVAEHLVVRCESPGAPLCLQAAAHSVTQVLCRNSNHGVRVHQQAGHLPLSCCLRHGTVRWQLWRMRSAWSEAGEGPSATWDHDLI